MSITTYKRVKDLVADGDNCCVVHLAHWVALPDFCSCHVHNPAQVQVHVVKDCISKHVC